MTSAQVVETSVTNNSSFQNYSHPDDHPDDHTIRPTDNDSINNVNCYGSVVGSDGAPSGPFITDSEMSHSSDPRKRPISEASSDDASGGLALNLKNLSKKSQKGSLSGLKVVSRLGRLLWPKRVVV